MFRLLWKAKQKDTNQNRLSKSVPLGIPNWLSLLGWKFKPRSRCFDSKKEDKLEQTTQSVADVYEQCGLL